MATQIVLAILWIMTENLRKKYIYIRQSYNTKTICGLFTLYFTQLLQEARHSHFRVTQLSNEYHELFAIKTFHAMWDYTVYSTTTGTNVTNVKKKSPHNYSVLALHSHDSTNLSVYNIYSILTPQSIFTHKNLTKDFWEKNLIAISCWDLDVTSDL